MIGAVIGGKYRIVRWIGAGGMGAVYEAVHMGTGRRVAVKVIASGDLSASDDAVQRFQREARAAGAIDSRHIVQMLDMGCDAGTGSHFIVMDLLAGEDLHHVIERMGPLRPSLAVAILAQACAGLARAHEAGVVHRDIKPANIFLARSDRGEVIVKLLDFGIAKVMKNPLDARDGAALTRTGSVLGSPMYMSPEQMTRGREVDHRSDVWSLGVVLYAALTGRAPWQHVVGLGELVVSVCTRPPRSVRERAPWVPATLAEITHTALTLRPERRFASAEAMSCALRALLPQGASLNELAFTPLTAEERGRRDAISSGADSRALSATGLLEGLGGHARLRRQPKRAQPIGADSLLGALPVGGSPLQAWPAQASPLQNDMPPNSVAPSSLPPSATAPAPRRHVSVLLMALVVAALASSLGMLTLLWATRAPVSVVPAAPQLPSTLATSVPPSPVDAATTPPPSVSQPSVARAASSTSQARDVDAGPSRAPARAPAPPSVPNGARVSASSAPPATSAASPPQPAASPTSMPSPIDTVFQ